MLRIYYRFRLLFRKTAGSLVGGVSGTHAMQGSGISFLFSLGFPRTSGHLRNIVYPELKHSLGACHLFTCLSGSERGIAAGTRTLFQVQHGPAGCLQLEGQDTRLDIMRIQSGEPDAHASRDDLLSGEWNSYTRQIHRGMLK